jgi:hypothetical protein
LCGVKFRGSPSVAGCAGNCLAEAIAETQLMTDFGLWNKYRKSEHKTGGEK